ncbi:MAG: hypothetical protein LBW85_04110 [Deltaproteobacteria bacterium]|nr:hypothetical protein [Deltaproteobacteria bacterium]
MPEAFPVVTTLEPAFDEAAPEAASEEAAPEAAPAEVLPDKAFSEAASAEAAPGTPIKVIALEPADDEDGPGVASDAAAPEPISDGGSLLAAVDGQAEGSLASGRRATVELEPAPDDVHATPAAEAQAKALLRLLADSGQGAAGEGQAAVTVAAEYEEAGTGGNFLDFIPQTESPQLPVVEIPEAPGPVDIPGVAPAAPSEPWGGAPTPFATASPPSDAAGPRSRPTVIALDEEAVEPAGEGWDRSGEARLSAAPSREPEPAESKTAEPEAAEPEPAEPEPAEPEAAEPEPDVKAALRAAAPPQVDITSHISEYDADFDPPDLEENSPAFVASGLAPSAEKGLEPLPSGPGAPEGEDSALAAPQPGSSGAAAGLEAEAPSFLEGEEFGEPVPSVPVKNGPDVSIVSSPAGPAFPWAAAPEGRETLPPAESPPEIIGASPQEGPSGGPSRDDAFSGLGPVVPAGALDSLESLDDSPLDPEPAPAPEPVYPAAMESLDGELPSEPGPAEVDGLAAASASAMVGLAASPPEETGGASAGEAGPAPSGFGDAEAASEADVAAEAASEADVAAEAASEADVAASEEPSPASSPDGGEAPASEGPAPGHAASLWKDGAQRARARAPEPAPPASRSAESDFLESNTNYVGADTSSLVDPGTGGGGGEEAPPFERRPAGSTVETPYSSGPSGQKQLPETSTAVIVNYLDDKDDGMFAADMDAPELGAEDDMDIDLLEIPTPAPFLAKPMTPVPKAPR